jgi:hypothetical protein
MRRYAKLLSSVYAKVVLSGQKGSGYSPYPPASGR